MRKRKIRKTIKKYVVLFCLCFCLSGCAAEQKDKSANITNEQVSKKDSEETVDTKQKLEEDLKETKNTEQISEMTSKEEKNSKEDKDSEQTNKEDMKEDKDSTKEDSTESQNNNQKIASPSNSGALQVKGSQLCDENGNPVMLRGLSTHGLAWFPEYVNEKAIKEFHEEWGMNVIRLALYSGEYNGYCTGGNKKELRSVVKKGVKYATQNDMYVIIDWHILSDGNPNIYKNTAIDFFSEMSSEYADYNNVIYEICNEPNGDTSWTEVKMYANEIIPVIRANDPDAIIIVGTPNWCQSVKDAAQSPITGYENIMYSLHFYASTHSDWLRNDMAALVNEGFPIFVSEFGICEASGSGIIDYDEANAWVEQMEASGVSYCGWNISNKDETSAVIKDSCNKTSGWTVDDLSESGKWMYETIKRKGQ